MSNYSVPFDYDGKNFIGVEFLLDKERNICVYYFENKSTLKHKLCKEFVRFQNLVEIREINDFKLHKTFSNIGD